MTDSTTTTPVKKMRSSGKVTPAMVTPEDGKIGLVATG